MGIKRVIWDDNEKPFPQTVYPVGERNGTSPDGRRRSADGIRK